MRRALFSEAYWRFLWKPPSVNSSSPRSPCWPSPLEGLCPPKRDFAFAVISNALSSNEKSAQDAQSPTPLCATHGLSSGARPMRPWNVFDFELSTLDRFTSMSTRSSISPLGFWSPVARHRSLPWSRASRRVLCVPVALAGFLRPGPAGNAASVPHASILRVGVFPRVVLPVGTQPAAAGCALVAQPLLAV